MREKKKLFLPFLIELSSIYVSSMTRLRKVIACQNLFFLVLIHASICVCLDAYEVHDTMILLHNFTILLKVFHDKRFLFFFVCVGLMRLVPSRKAFEM